MGRIRVDSPYVTVYGRVGPIHYEDYTKLAYRKMKIPDWIKVTQFARIMGIRRNNTLNGTWMLQMLKVDDGVFYKSQIPGSINGIRTEYDPTVGRNRTIIEGEFDTYH